MRCEKNSIEKRLWDITLREKEYYQKIIEDQRQHIALLREQRKDMQQKIFNLEKDGHAVIKLMGDTEEFSREIISEARAKAKNIVEEAEKSKKDYMEKINEYQKEFCCVKTRLEGIANDILTKTAENGDNIKKTV